MGRPHIDALRVHNDSIRIEVRLRELGLRFYLRSGLVFPVEHEDQRCGRGGGVRIRPVDQEATVSAARGTMDGEFFRGVARVERWRVVVVAAFAGDGGAIPLRLRMGGRGSSAEESAEERDGCEVGEDFHY